MADFRWVLPGELRLSPTRPEGADDYKLALQEAEYGSSTDGMPPIEVIVGTDGEMIIFNGMTRPLALIAIIPMIQSWLK